MMLQIGLNLASSASRPLQAQQSSEGLMLFVTSNDMAVTVSAKSVPIEVSASSAHAGSYSLAFVDLARAAMPRF